MKQSLLSVLGALLAIVSIATVAVASNWGADPTVPAHYCTTNDPDSECTADNQDHVVYFESNVQTSLRNALLDSMADDYRI